MNKTVTIVLLFAIIMIYAIYLCKKNKHSKKILHENFNISNGYTTREKLSNFIHDIRNYRFINRTDFTNLKNNLFLFEKIYNDVMFNKLKLVQQNIDVAEDTRIKILDTYDYIRLGLITDRYVLASFDKNRINLDNILMQCIMNMLQKIDNNNNFDRMQPRASNFYQDIQSQELLIK